MATTGWGTVDVFWSDLPLDLAGEMCQQLNAVQGLVVNMTSEGRDYAPDIAVEINKSLIRVRIEGFPWWVSLKLGALMAWERRGFNGPVEV